MKTKNNEAKNNEAKNNEAKNNEAKNNEAKNNEAKKKKKYYNPETRITKDGFLLRFSNTITKDNEINNTLNGAYAYVDVLKNYFGFDGRVSDDSKWMLKSLYKCKEHKGICHGTFYEAVVLACIYMAYERCGIKFEFDLVEFIESEWESKIQQQNNIIDQTNFIYAYLKTVFNTRTKIEKLKPIVTRY